MSSLPWRTPNNGAQERESQADDFQSRRQHKIQVILQMTPSQSSDSQNRNQTPNRSRIADNSAPAKWKRFLYITVDNSEGMKGQKLTDMVSLLKGIIEDTPYHTKVVIRQFASQLKTLVTAPAGKLDLNRLQEDIRGKKSDIGQKSALYDAWGQTVDEVPYDCYKTGKVHVVLLTDGIDIVSKNDDSKSAIKLVKDMLKKDNFFFTFVQVGHAGMERFSSVADNLKKQCGRNPRCKVVHVEEFLDEVVSGNQRRHFQLFDEPGSNQRQKRNESNLSNKALEVGDSLVKLQIAPSLEKQVSITISVPTNSFDSGSQPQSQSQTAASLPSYKNHKKMTVAERMAAQHTNTGDVIPEQGNIEYGKRAMNDEREKSESEQKLHRNENRKSFPVTADFARPTSSVRDNSDQYKPRSSYARQGNSNSNWRDDAEDLRKKGATESQKYVRKSSGAEHPKRSSGAENTIVTKDAPNHLPSSKAAPASSSSSNFDLLCSRLGWDMRLDDAKN